MKPYLLEIGVEEEDKVISIPDGSFNSSLFLCDRKGWTDYVPLNDPEQISFYISRGAKYLFITDVNLLEKDYLKPFINNQVGEFKGILIFKLPSDTLK